MLHERLRIGRRLRPLKERQRLGDHVARRRRGGIGERAVGTLAANISARLGWRT